MSNERLQQLQDLLLNLPPADHATVKHHAAGAVLGSRQGKGCTARHRRRLQSRARKPLWRRAWPSKAKAVAAPRHGPPAPAALTLPKRRAGHPDMLAPTKPAAKDQSQSNLASRCTGRSASPQLPPPPTGVKTTRRWAWSTGQRPRAGQDSHAYDPHLDPALPVRLCPRQDGKS